jgi:hypothetical protein
MIESDASIVAPLVFASSVFVTVDSMEKKR